MHLMKQKSKQNNCNQHKAWIPIELKLVVYGKKEKKSTSTAAMKTSKSSRGLAHCKAALIFVCLCFRSISFTHLLCLTRTDSAPLLVEFGIELYVCLYFALLVVVNPVGVVVLILSTTDDCKIVLYFFFFTFKVDCVRNKHEELSSYSPVYTYVYIECFGILLNYTLNGAHTIYNQPRASERTRNVFVFASFYFFFFIFIFRIFRFVQTENVE